MTTGLHLHLDSADRAALEACLPHPLVHGLTTNPTLMWRAGVGAAQRAALLKWALTLGLRQVQAQVGCADAPGMLREAQTLLADFAPGRLVIKLPATRDGLQAGAQLAAAGHPVTFTAVYALEQVQFAAQLGAAYAAPYLGRLHDSGEDGLGLIARMQTLLARSGASTRLLVASVRTRADFAALLDLGVGAITVPPALFLEMLSHPATEAAERAFLADAQATSSLAATADGSASPRC